jgi:hypothetical protein
MATNETIKITTYNNIIKIPNNNYQSISLEAIKIPIEHENQFKIIPELILCIQTNEFSIPIDLLLMTSIIKTNNTHCIIIISNKIFLKNNLPPNAYFKLNCSDPINCTFIIKTNETQHLSKFIIHRYHSLQFVNMKHICLPAKILHATGLFIGINKKLTEIILGCTDIAFYHSYNTIKANNDIIKEREKFRNSNLLSETLLSNIPIELISIIEKYEMDRNFIYWIPIGRDKRCDHETITCLFDEHLTGIIYVASEHHIKKMKRKTPKSHSL